MNSMQKVLSLILLFAFALICFTPTGCLSMRQPSSRNDGSRKESYRGEDRQRRSSYHEGDQSRRDGSTDTNYGMHQNRHSDEGSHAERSRKRKPEIRDDRIQDKRHRIRNTTEEPWKTEEPKRSRAIGPEQTARNDLKASEEETKRLNKDYFQYSISRLRAENAKVTKGNTNYEAWANKYVELETAKSNIRRHERVGKLLEHRIPGVSQALCAQGDRLKAKPDQLEKEMAQLKSEGKYDRDVFWSNFSKDNRKRWRYWDQINKHADLMHANKEKIRKYEESRGHTCVNRGCQIM